MSLGARSDDFLAVIERSTSWQSSVHGLVHWRRVAANGAELAAETPGADAGIIALFALFHDSMRDNDGHDPQHGRRGGALARELSGLRGDRLELLVHACEYHADGLTSDDPTVGCCWDADRLDLPRVGIAPHASYLSTEAAKRRV